ncbi:hypothetical protein [Erythrobacter litoralis]|uniref:Uncharacterized protein n=1 Tax=Erythrobacter litoralis (strain HTCC2594) TaxID=314225 RepID=Q2N6S9_ERYLH|nr:hypothetical protein [Erythrobacter litoralis]ABC64612.1 hypothetical protein ELI_12600 [Erythrobacter litoralis HTCC2594]
MNAQPNTLRESRSLPESRSSAQSLSVQWTALQDAASAVAALAGLAPERVSPQIRNFPALIKDIGGWRFELACDLIGDLSAIMRPGLTALLAVNARGQDATAAALTLWREYHHARAAVLALVPEGGQMGPRRSA